MKHASSPLPPFTRSLQGLGWLSGLCLAAAPMWAASAQSQEATAEAETAFADQATETTKHRCESLATQLTDDQLDKQGPLLFAPLAKQKAQAPWDGSGKALPEPLADVDYDGYMAMHYKPDQALLLGQGDKPYSLQGFHRAKPQAQKVDVYRFHNGDLVRWPYDRSAFQFRTPPAPEGWDVQAADAWTAEHGPVGWAGVRVHRSWTPAGHADELVSFLGATYFRALGQGDWYGASARLVAVNTGLNLTGTGQPSDNTTPESFPAITALAMHTPTPRDQPLVVDGLLEGEHLTGAVRWTIHPGQPTEMDVEIELNVRKDIEKLGLAPVTSMFLFGESPDPRFSDVRPEVHDSDSLQWRDDQGLQVRPLYHPKHARVRDFATQGGLQGFGLMQRDRNFDHYQDTEAHYDRRPSVWVEPKGDWPKGQLELLELTADGEWMDNMGLYYKVDGPVQSGDVVHVAYKLSWGKHSKQMPSQPLEDTDPAMESLAKWVGLARGASPEPVWWVRFENLGADPARVQAKVKTADGTEIEGAQLVPLDDGTVRVAIAQKQLPDNAQWPVSVRLETSDQVVSETVWLPLTESASTGENNAGPNTAEQPADNTSVDANKTAQAASAASVAKG